MSKMSDTKKSKADYSSTPLDLSSKKQKLSAKDNKEMKNDITILSDEILTTISDKLLSVERHLCNKLKEISFHSPIEYVYNPIEYAFDVHAMYVQKYCRSTKKILFLGMNPGPWGMSQTGVPFGEISMVRDWLKLSGSIGKPDREQPDRKVTGFECKRSEISGKRFWTLFQELCGDPTKFFQHAYLHNYCPFALMDSKGRNITPAELKTEEQKILHDLCDQALAETVQLLQSEIIIGIGRYAEKRAQTALKAANVSAQVLFLPHPSPRAVNNGNWNEKAVQKLTDFGLLQLFKN